MATFKLNYVSRPELLKEIDLRFLRQLLKRYKEYFSKRGLDLTVSDEDDFDYDQLSSILMLPGDAIPPKLVDDLFFIDEMSTQAAMDELLDALKELPRKERTSLRLPAGPTPTDLAVRVRMVNPDLLERMHAEHYSRNLPQSRRSFRYFVSKDTEKKFRRPKDKVIKQLESTLNKTLEEMKRGRTAKVYVFKRDDGVWFLVRHGHTCKREGTITSEGSSSIYYRPEIYDVLKYDAVLRELCINAETEKLYTLYRQEFGRYFFGDKEIFRGDGKFTLDPLKEMGEDAMYCNDVDGIDYVRLKEIQYLWPNGELEIRRANDLFISSPKRKTGLLKTPRIIQASFTVRFSNIKTERTVKIRPSNRATYTRDPNAACVEEWLEARGFILERDTGDE